MQAAAARFFFELKMLLAHRVKLAALITLALVNPVLADQRLDLLKQISTAGAPMLTLKMLDQAQPGIDHNLYEWILWEQERWAILTEWQLWNQLLIRIETLPPDIPDQFRQQAATFKARAFLELGQYRSARRVLRAQLWQDQARQSADYESWRRLVIESYIDDGRTEDARVAMLRFDQDFSSTDLSWLLLRARVLIESGRYQQAMQILKGRDEWQARLTSTLANFRQGGVDKAELWRQVNSRGKDATLDADERSSLWALGYFAAQQMSAVDRVVALEALFRSERQSPLKVVSIARGPVVAGLCRIRRAGRKPR